MIFIILAILVALSIWFAGTLFMRTKTEPFTFNLHSIYGLAIGFIADFLDTLGIGSFLVTTLLFKWTRFIKDDKKLPGTLNVIHSIPTVVEALFFITVVKVDLITLISMVVASVIGMKVGAAFVVKMNRQRIQRIMSFALFVTALLMTAKILGWVNLLGASNVAMGLTGWRLAVGVVGNFILGSLMSAGVGLYSPCMVMIYLLGMNPIAAFPIMMTSCAALMPIGSLTYVKTESYEKKAVWYMILGGILGVIVAAVFVKSISMELLTWIIIAAGLVTSALLFKSSTKKEKKALA